MNDDLLAPGKIVEPPPREFSEHDAYALRRIRAIVREDALERHGDRPGEPSWDVIADCVLANACQHRQAREILKTPQSLTLDQHATMISQQLELDTRSPTYKELHDILVRLGRTAAEARGVRYNGVIIGSDGIQDDVLACTEAMKRSRKAGK